MNGSNGSSLLTTILATTLLMIFITSSWRVAQFSVHATQSYGFSEQIFRSTEGLMLFARKLVKNKWDIFNQRGSHSYVWSIKEWPVGNSEFSGAISVDFTDSITTIRVNLVDPYNQAKKMPILQATLIRQGEEILCREWCVATVE